MQLDATLWVPRPSAKDIAVEIISLCIQLDSSILLYTNVTKSHTPFPMITACGGCWCNCWLFPSSRLILQWKEEELVEEVEASAHQQKQVTFKKLVTNKIAAILNLMREHLTKSGFRNTSLEVSGLQVEEGGREGQGREEGGEREKKSNLLA